eukprot:1255293-Prorocentrum_lima.AAC.1
MWVQEKTPLAHATQASFVGKGSLEGGLNPLGNCGQVLVCDCEVLVDGDVRGSTVDVDEPNIGGNNLAE